MTSVSRIFLVIFYIIHSQCYDTKIIENSSSEDIKVQNKLSDYGILKKDPGLDSIQYRADGFLYDLNTPLFSDYAEKERVVFLPKGTKMKYDPVREFGMPVGTIVSKTFMIPEGFTRLDKKTIKFLETRLLIHKKEGWFAVSYIWDEKGQDANIAYAGGNIPMKTKEGEEFIYSVPSRNQCAFCHQNYTDKNQTIVPIGIKAKHLNKDMVYFQNGEKYSKNQLRELTSRKLLQGLPLWGIPRVPPYNDLSFDLEDRARAYLDINCAHCHNQNSAAGMNSQLILSYEEEDLGDLGFCKTPGSAGKGGGGMKYDIVPGYPEESILYYRTKTQDSGAMMPQIGRTLTHKEGVEVLQEWIANMDSQICP